MTEEINSYGLPKNMFKILDSTIYRGPDSELIPIENARNELCASVVGPNQIIFDTGYQKISSDWSTSHQLFCRWFSNITTGKGITVQYWKKDKDGNEINVYNTSPDWHSDISPIQGSGIGNAFFKENDNYRIKIVSHSSLATDKWVAVDFIIIKPVNEFNITSYYIYGGTVPITENRIVDTIEITFSNSTTASANYTLPESDWHSLSVFTSVYGSADYIIGYKIINSTTITIYARCLTGAVTGAQSVDLDISMFIPQIEL